MAINLSRNTRVWFTTNVNPVTGVLPDATTGYAAFSAANTYEIQVQDGYSFTQGTEQQTITLNEAGNAPVRGQRSFNTALNPVEFSISTYIRPYLSTTVQPIERVLWNALMSPQAIGTAPQVTASSVTRATTLTNIVSIVATTSTSLSSIAVGDALNIQGSTNSEWNVPGVVTAISGATATVALGKAPSNTSGTTAAGASIVAWTGAWASGASTGNGSYCSFIGSNKHTLTKFALIFLVDNTFYAIDNCSLNQATIDFGLDAISMVAWSGNGTKLKQLANITTATQLTSTAYVSTANYITNKLSTMILTSNIGGASGTTYNVPLTGGSITINNNISYLTPQNLGVVNEPIGYFTGTRSITGTVNAYLRTGTTTESGALLNAILAAGAETKYSLEIEVGGGSNANRIEFDMPGVTVQVPTIEVADVISTTINFTAQGHNPDWSTGTAGVYDLTQTNDMTVRYYSS